MLFCGQKSVICSGFPMVLLPRSLRPIPTALAPALLALSLLTALEAAAVSAWECRAGPDGEWECGQTELDSGPYERGPLAPIYTRPQTTAAGESAPVTERRVHGQTPEQAELNWVPRQALPAATRENMPEWCAGAYQEPLLAAAELDADMDSGRVDIRAEEVDYLLGPTKAMYRRQGPWRDDKAGVWVAFPGGVSKGEVLHSKEKQCT